MIRSFLIAVSLAAVLAAAVWAQGAPAPTPKATAKPTPAGLTGPAVAPTAAPSATPAPAAASGGIRIGYVDLDRVVEGSESVKRKIKTVESSLDTRKEAYNQKRQQLAALQAKMKQQDSVLPDAEKAKIKSQIAQLTEDLDLMGYQMEKQIKKTSQDVIEPVLDEVLKAVERVAQTNKIDLVLRGDLVLFSSERVDLTKHVIAELDRTATAGAAPASRPISPAATPASRSK